MSKTTHQDVFSSLKAILSPYAKKNHVVTDEPDNFQLYSPKKDRKDRDIYFGGVQIKKNYVSYHLMAVYVFPELLDNVSPDLKKRMQGKSCFNFKSIDTALFTELEALTKLCQTRFDEMEKPPY